MGGLGTSPDLLRVPGGILVSKSGDRHSVVQVGVDAPAALPG